jgi:hypothetical protein
MSNILHNYKFKKMENNFDSIEIENAIESFPDFGYCNKMNEECLKNYLTFDILMLFIEKLFEVDNLNCAACLMRNGQLHDCLPNYKQANPRYFHFLNNIPEEFAMVFRLSKNAINNLFFEKKISGIEAFALTKISENFCFKNAINSKQ